MSAIAKGYSTGLEDLWWERVICYSFHTNAWYYFRELGFMYLFLGGQISQYNFYQYHIVVLSIVSRYLHL
jgi:hypothetical protein